MRGRIDREGELERREIAAIRVPEDGYGNRTDNEHRYDVEQLQRFNAASVGHGLLTQLRTLPMSAGAISPQNCRRRSRQSPALQGDHDGLPPFLQKTLLGTHGQEIMTM